MSSATSLQGLRVLVTRPADQAETLCRLLEGHGASVTRLPLQAIEPTRQAGAAARRLQETRSAQAWIFTSANAARHARQLDAGVWPPCIAVGPATAAALAQLGITGVVVPAERHDSEGVLALTELADVQGRDFVVITGEGGRESIESELAARGARVERVEVYRRVALPHTPDAVARALEGIDAMIVTNGESLQQLVARVPPAVRPALLATQLVVPSRRVVEQALELGFTATPLVPEQIADAGYFRCLEQWWGTTRRAVPTDTRMTDDKNEAPLAADEPPASSESPPVAPTAASAAVRGAGAVWRVLAGLLLIAILAAAGWEGYRRGQALLQSRDARIEALAQSLNAAEAQADRLQTRLSDQAVTVQRNAAEIARFAGRLAAQDEAIGLLREELGGGRTRVQLAVVEQLLILANDRLQVGREVPPAIAALEAADARLAALKDPRLFPVREAISRERAALQAVPLPDDVGAALTLSGLIARAPRLTLATQAPEHFEARPHPVAPLPEDASAWMRAWAAVKRAVGSAFTIRRDDGPAPQLLSDEQTALIRQVLAMKLEGARLALLRRDAASFRDLCASAAAWLDDYFHAGDPSVSAARAELQRLQALQLSPPLPDISRSLVLLRGQLEPAPQ